MLYENDFRTLIHDKMSHSTYFPGKFQITFTFLCRLSGFIEIRKAIKTFIEIDYRRTLNIFLVLTSQLNSILSFRVLTCEAITHTEYRKHTIERENGIMSAFDFVYRTIIFLYGNVTFKTCITFKLYLNGLFE